MPRAFVIRPFNVKKDSAGLTLDFERVHTELVEPALSACKLDGSTTGEIVEPGNIREDMFAMIIEADLVICDITIHNANVFYELGIRHALRKKRTVMIKGGPTADSTPFDILTDRYVPYDLNKPGDAAADLIAAVQAALASDRDTDSPIFKMLTGLPEADPAKIQVVPLGFREDVARARAAKSKGWLRLLAHEVRGLRFERVGLQVIAEALWKLGDYIAARECLERVRETVPDDHAANLALANVYERLYRTDRIPQLLSASDQAVERVLASKSVGTQSRVEALALKGRNSKTRWREQFEDDHDDAARRATAMNQMLRQSYDAYREAFQQDLNHFYSGLAALQMGVIFLELSKDDGWTQSFDTDAEAAAYRSRVESEVAALRLIVGSSVEAALRRLPPADPDRVWAEISKADLLFLTEDGAQRLMKRYADVIPSDNPFAWDATRGQLALFANLGVRAELARAVIATIDARTIKKVAVEQKEPLTKPLQVVVFAGHRVDSPDRVQPRFPATLEQPARDAIYSVLNGFAETHTVVGLASAAPGADIVFHEVCAQIGISSTVCLPMPLDDYVQSVFDSLDWRNRFLKLVHEKKKLRPPAILELSDRPGLPPWLHGSGTNAWERGNRWVLEMAVTAGAATVTLLTVWDGQYEGDAAGGTAHMVSIARETAAVEIYPISTASLAEASRP